MAIRVTVWNEYVHERKDEAIATIYPDGIHGAIATGLRRELGESVQVATATLDEPSHGLTPDLLESTDVLLWWGHIRHREVDDSVVDAVYERLHQGMGLIALHSAQGSKIFKRLMGTTCELNWRHNDSEKVWTVNPAHPIAHGVPHPIVIPEQEMYGEFFDIPTPDELVFVSSFGGGEVFRSGCCFLRGSGRVFYFSPGHEEHPVYHQPEIQLVLANAVKWACAR